MLLPDSIFIEVRKMNKFGLWRCSGTDSIPQLFDALRIKRQSVDSEKLMKFLESVTKKHLDINLTAKPQKKGLKRIELELKCKFPEWFDRYESEKRLYIAIRVVITLQSGLRARRRVQKRNAYTSSNLAPISTKGGIIDLTLDGSDSETQSQTRDIKEEENESKNTTNAFGGVSTTPLQGSHALHYNIPCNDDESHTSSVRQFLQTCRPPMDHMLQRFLDFGCSNKEYLQSLSAWPREKRYVVLKNILVGSSTSAGPMSVTEMDLAVLENQFVTFKFL